MDIKTKGSLIFYALKGFEHRFDKAVFNSEINGLKPLFQLIIKELDNFLSIMKTEGKETIYNHYIKAFNQIIDKNSDLNIHKKFYI